MLIMDLSQVAISTIMAELKNTNNADISVPLVRHMILNAIRANRQKFYREYGELVLAVDSRHYWRKDVFPHYKASRKKSRSQSIYNWDQIFEAINAVKDDLQQYFPYAFIEVDGAEADDVISTLVQWTAENDYVDNGLESGPQPVMILSGDHDFIQLHRFSHVQQYSPIQKTFIKATEPISHILTEHILRGDTGDGIPNVFSDEDTFVSEKKRQKPIYEKDMVVWKTQPLENWENTPQWERIQKNQELIDLRYVPRKLQADIVLRYLTDKDKRDRSQLLNYFMANKMAVMMQSAGDF